MLEPAGANARSDVRLAFLQWLLNVDANRRDWYRAYREYYDGDQDTQLSDRMRAFLQVKLNEKFNSNYCPIVVDAKAERLSVTGFTGEDETFNEEAWAWWGDNRMDARQGHVHLASIRDGDSYVMVEWDNEANAPRFAFEPAYDGDAGVDVRYSTERRGEILYAVKYWRVEAEEPELAGKVRRLNVYYPDRIEKYESNDDHMQGDWQLLDEAEWVTREGEPLGVPVIAFRNNSQGYDYGTSELKNVVPLQNALNKSLIDMLAAADVAGFRIYVGTGADWSEMDVTPGMLVWARDHQARLSAIEAGDLRPLIALKDSFAVEVARVTRTPLHYFQVGQQRAASDTLKQEEQGLISRVEDAQVSYGNAWEDVMYMARRLANTYGGASFDEEEVISTEWEPAAVRDDSAELAQAQARLALGVPRETVLAEVGYSPDEIDAMRDSDEWQARQSLLRQGMQDEGAMEG